MFDFNSIMIRVAFLALSALCVATTRGQSLDDPRQLRFDDKRPLVRVVAMPKDGQEIDDSLYEQLRAEIERAAEGGPTFLVIDINSGGGRIDHAREIVSLIRKYREHDTLRIVAYVGPEREAISAAAWLALSCRGLIMAPDGRLGDIQPIALGMTGFERVPEKLVTKLTEDVWLSARDNGLERQYPELFVRAMVDTDIDIYEVTNPRLGTSEFMRASEYAAMNPRDTEGLQIEEITLPNKALTTNGSDMLRFGFPIRLIDHREELVDVLGTSDATFEVVELVKPSPLDFGIDWSWLLLLLGVIFLALEFQAPGLGIFGILGVVTLIGFFLVQAGWSDTAIVPIALLLFGIFLVLVEAVLLPGLLVPGIAGILLMLYATWTAVASSPGDPFPFPDFGDPAEREILGKWALTVVGTILIAGFTSVMLGRYLHRIPLIGKIVIVPPPSVSTDAGLEHVGHGLGALRAVNIEVGQIGEALTDLRPSGVARIGGAKVDVIGRGAFIEKGSQLEVRDVKGNRVIVRRLDSSPEERAS